MIDYLLSRFNSFLLDTKGLTANNLLDRSRKSFQHINGSNTLVICLPGWGQKLWTWGIVKSYIVGSGVSFLAYEFPQSILSDQHKLTKDCFEIIDQTVREDVKKLKDQYKFSRCVMVTLSLASSFGSMIYKDNHDITDIILIVPGENLARDMWHGCRTQHLRRSYERQGITLEQLETLWHDLASENNMPTKSTNIIIHLGKKDKIIPYNLSQTLVTTLQKQSPKPITKIYLYSGHYLVIYRSLLLPSLSIRLKNGLK